MYFQKGFKSILKTSLIQLKIFENKILNLQYDDLLHFLLNDTFKSGFFKDENYEKFIKAMKEVNVKLDLINNLENEYMLDKKLAEIAEKSNVKY